LLTNKVVYIKKRKKEAKSFLSNKAYRRRWSLFL